MTVFLSTLEQMAFLFSLIILGYLLVRAKVLDNTAAGILSKLENWLFVPALVMGTFITKFTVDVLKTASHLFLFSFAIIFVMMPVSFLIARFLARDKDKRNVYIYGLVFANFGFMGNAVVSALYPDIFFEYLVFSIPLWMMIYMWGVPVLLMPVDSANKGIKARLKNFLNPMFVCMIIGMIIGLTGLKLPNWTMNVINTCGNCMSPVAMLLTGMTIAKIDLKRVLTDISIYAVTFIRLILIPLVAIGLFYLLPVPKTIFICAICSLAMPLGLTTVVIPAAYGKDTTTASGMALISHFLSCITIPLIFLLMEFILAK